jgi:hypothetical protein
MVKGRTFGSREELVILEKAMNPTGGAIIFGVLAETSPGMQSEVWLYSKTLGEPPSADPLAWVVWGGGEKNSPLPD